MGKAFHSNGYRNKKLIRSAQFQTQFAVSSSYQIPLFKTGSIDQLTTEEYKVLVYALQHHNKTMEKEHKKIMKEQGQSSGDKMTYSIRTEHGK